MPTPSDNLYLHVDGDSFFVACEVSIRPDLVGKPVVVGADKGIAVAMSKEAKSLGVTRGMPVFRIKKFYPEVIILDHNFPLYEDISRRLHQILSAYFVEVEVYSIDECFALVQPFEIKYYGGEQKLMTRLKKEIEDTLSVTYSLGLARTKALSKLASKLEKPNGLVILMSKESEIRALKSTAIDDIWGIGRRTIPRLEQAGLKSAYDFSQYSSEIISKSFPTPVLILQKEFRGENILKVESNIDPRDQKSIQSTATFRPSSSDPKIIKRELSVNTERACKEARKLHLVSNRVSFFLKTSDFKYKFDEVRLDQFTADPGVMLSAIDAKLIKILRSKDIIRATGITLHNLVRQEDVPLDLFGNQENALARLAVEEAADRIRNKFGINSIKRATSLGKTSPTHTSGSSFKKKNT